MTERMHTYGNTVESPTGREYRAHAVGAERADGMWEGRIVFEPLDAPGERVETDRETTQPNRTDLEYWVSGVEPAFLEGALERALRRVARGDDSG